MIISTRPAKIFLLSTLAGLSACSQLPSRDADASAGVTLSRKPFGTLSNGAPVEAIVLKNAGGLSATLISYGATVQSLSFPDKQGNPADLAVGYDTLAGYEKTPGYTNVTVGRYANRIANGTFGLDGKKFALDVNEKPNTLHGGTIGWDKRNWVVKSVEQTAEKASVTFTLTSPDGDQGFPGTVVADVTYELNNKNDLTIRYGAKTDKPTVVNLTWHSMLNLSGIPATRLATDAEVTIESDAILPVNETLIPTGQPLPVAGTPFDFRTPGVVTERVKMQHPQLALANGGIDHNYLIRGGKTATPKPAVKIEDRNSGRGMTIATTEPGMQVYTGNFLKGEVVGKGGQKLTKYQSISFEAQGYPDSPNQSAFPTTRVDPGRDYSQTTVLHFYKLDR
nr:aldose epimerase family protein [uncultured Duganella sp.]